MAIYVEINPREREATLRSAHSLCAGESVEIVLSGVPDADTATLSLRLYRDRSEAEFVAAARRPGDADPPQEGFAAVQGRAALRRAVLDLRSESVASWASDVFERSESESDGPEGAPRPPETAWMVVADVSRVWAACEVPFLLRPMSPESADVALTLPSLVERAREAAESAERSASAASEAAGSASAAADRAEAATSGKADLVDGKVPASQLPSYVDDVLEYDSASAFPETGESGKIYVDKASNAAYRWSGSAYVEVSPSRDWSGELASKRGLTDLAVDPDKWLLVKPDGTQAWLENPDPQQSTWTGDGFTLTYGGGDGGEFVWGLVKTDGSGDWVVDDTSQLPSDADRLEFLGSDDVFSVYRLVRGSRLALDTEIPAVDDAVARTSANPVKSSGIWAAIWGALAALPSGFVSLYDWCVAQLSGKRGKTDLAVYADAWSLLLAGTSDRLILLPTPQAGYWTDTGTVDGQNAIRFIGDGFYRLFLADGTRGVANDVPEGAAEITFLDEDLESEVVAVATKQVAATSDTLAKTSQIPTVPSAGTVAPLMDGAANAGSSANYARSDHVHPTDITRAAAADLRYRIAEAAVRKTLPADCFPVTFTYEGGSYSVNSLVEQSEASAVGDMYLEDLGDTYSITMVLQPETESEAVQLLKVAYLDADGVFESSDLQDLQFGGVSPVADTSPTLAHIQVLADRTVNLITATDETSIDIDLPAAVTVDGVRRARDFILDVDNYAGASDVGLELASDATAYLDAGDAHYLVAVADGDDLADLLTVAAGKRARLYFTETAQTATPTGGTSAVPVISLQRLTITVGGAAS